MGVPKKKISRRRRGVKRAQLRLETVALAKCPKCHRNYVRHRVCSFCANS